MSAPGPIRYRRLMSPLNAAANAFLSLALTPPRNYPTWGFDPVLYPRMRLLYVRDMPKDGSQLSLDFSAFLGPLFYTWLSQARFRAVFTADFTPTHFTMRARCLC